MFWPFGRKWRKTKSVIDDDYIMNRQRWKCDECNADLLGRDLNLSQDKDLQCPKCGSLKVVKIVAHWRELGPALVGRHLGVVETIGLIAGISRTLPPPKSQNPRYEMTRR